MLCLWLNDTRKGEPVVKEVTLQSSINCEREIGTEFFPLNGIVTNLVIFLFTNLFIPVGARVFSLVIHLYSTDFLLMSDQFELLNNPKNLQSERE
jgi:hypothetical protein